MIGTIFLYYSFPFVDDGTKDKYFIILNDPGPTEHIITCITTSQPDHRADQEGCHHIHKLYVLNPNYNFFPKKTWIQFYRLFKFRREIFNKSKQNGNIEEKSILKPTTVRAIINCIVKSEDIPYYDLQLIRR